MIYKLITPPAAEPVTTQEAKSAARITTSDFDSDIPGLIKAGREAAESFQNAVYLTQTWELIFDTFPELPIQIKKRPLQSLVSVKLIDEDGNEISMDINDFIVSIRSNKISLKSDRTWPDITLQEFDSVIFTFKSGYTDASKVPENVKLAIKLYVCHRIDNPDTDSIPDAFYNLLWPDRMVPV